MESKTRPGRKEVTIINRSDPQINSKDVVAEIKDGNPFCSIVVATQIAIRYSIESPLRGATGPDKPVLAIEKLKLLVSEGKDSEISALFDMFSRRILNEGNDLINDYEDDSYEAKTSDFQKLSPSQIVFAGDNDLEDDDFDDEFDEDEDDEDDDDVDNDSEDDDDKDPSEDDLEDITNE